MEAGAAGFLVKDAPADRLASAIRRAVAGERIVGTELAAAALQDGASPLTPRERQVLEAGAGGAPISDLAERLHLSEGTVRNYLSAAIGNTGARNRTKRGASHATGAGCDGRRTWLTRAPTTSLQRTTLSVAAVASTPVLWSSRASCCTRMIGSGGMISDGRRGG